MSEWGDVWAQGVKANQRTIDTFLDYNHEHGLTKARRRIDEVFAKGTLDT
jgi:hypothetical protein